MPAMHLSAQCNGPAKSIPVWENGEPSETLQADKSGEGWEQYGSPSSFLYLTIVYLTHKTQYCSWSATSVSLTSPCFIIVCISVTNNFTTWCSVQSSHFGLRCNWPCIYCSTTHKYSTAAYACSEASLKLWNLGTPLPSKYLNIIQCHRVPQPIASKIYPLKASSLL